MAWQQSNSLERYLTWRLSLLILPILFIGGYLVYRYSLPLWLAASTELLLLLLCLKTTNTIKNKVFKAFDRANLHLEAINQEDFHQYAKAAYKQGKVGEFHQQLNQLSKNLQQQKSRYDQHAFLVYQLISQLDTPVLVFNKKQQLSFGNKAFYQLFKQPWQVFRHSSPARLGLTKTNQQWQFTQHKHEQNQQWQIRHSEFIDNDESHQLLIFIDISSAIRTSQLNAWQQIIRVLSHEIRNSLAPVSSLAETLANKSNTDSSYSERDKTALNVITERCQHLQNFVEHYASLSKPFNINPQWLSITQLLTPLSALFEQLNISVNSKMDRLWADQTLLTQVLINLLKNAQEANANQVEITLSQQQQNYQITITDNGHGFNNLENLFVPLYSTKEQGQGIGLNFCRNIIEQHQGTLSLINNTNNQGVCVTIQLPQAPL
ncbi:MAG: ATP-binding protein [Alteromonadaceae bacterium]|nr:ATP-binding protein [Alteromonadaceae bacterium]